MKALSPRQVQALRDDPVEIPDRWEFRDPLQRVHVLDGVRPTTSSSFDILVMCLRPHSLRLVF